MRANLEKPEDREERNIGIGRRLVLRFSSALLSIYDQLKGAIGVEPIDVVGTGIQEVPPYIPIVRQVPNLGQCHLGFFTVPLHRSPSV